MSSLQKEFYQILLNKYSSLFTPQGDALITTDKVPIGQKTKCTFFYSVFAVFLKLETVHFKQSLVTYKMSI